MTLAVSRNIAVAVTLTAAAAQAQNLNTLLVLGSSPVIDTQERYRTYTSLTAVGGDFGNTTPEYLTASAYFAQSPRPAAIRIGRWAKTSTSGVLRGAKLSTAQQSLSPWNAITTGSFSLTKNGGSATPITGLNLSGATSLNQVASIITAALTGATMVWNSVFQRFELTSSVTGTTSSIAFLTATGSGQDISAMLLMQTGQGGYSVQGINAETALDAATLFDANYGQLWYALMMPEGVTADHLAVAAFIEGTNNQHFYGVTTQDAATLSAASYSTTLAYTLKESGYDRTTVQYSSSSAYAVASLIGRNLVVDYTGNNTVITSMYKQEPGVVPEDLNETQANALKDLNVNVFVKYDNGTNIVQYGNVCSGHFIDEIMGCAWFAVTVQNRLWNLLYTTVTKIPQTDKGMAVLTTGVEAVCQQAVDNGLFAPGVWNNGGFGTLVQGDFLPEGYYVYAGPMATQDPADRAARKATSIQCAGKLAGAIHTLSLAVTVNQ